MTGTGRLVGEVGVRTRQVVYGDLSPAEIEDELPLMVQVDRAHVVMLLEQKLISADAATGLLRCIDHLAADGWTPLLARPHRAGCT